MEKTTGAGNQKAEGGFTLLEILIATFLFALVVSAVLGAYSGTFGIIDETESQEDIYQKARIALERITGDLECAYFPERTQSSQTELATSEAILFHGEKKEISDLPCGELRFLSLAHLDVSDEKPLAEPAEIAYYGATGGDEGVLDLYRSDTALARERPESGTGGVILCKGLSSIDFTYYDAEGQPRENWNSDEGPSKGKLPSRVLILMEFPNPADSNRPYRFMTGVTIPMGG